MRLSLSWKNSAVVRIQRARMVQALDSIFQNILWKEWAEAYPAEMVMVVLS